MVQPDANVHVWPTHFQAAHVSRHTCMHACMHKPTRPRTQKRLAGGPAAVARAGAGADPVPGPRAERVHVHRAHRGQQPGQPLCVRGVGHRGALGAGARWRDRSSAGDAAGAPLAGEGFCWRPARSGVGRSQEPCLTTGRGWQEPCAAAGRSVCTHSPPPLRGGAYLPKPLDAHPHPPNLLRSCRKSAPRIASPSSWRAQKTRTTRSGAFRRRRSSCMRARRVGCSMQISQRQACIYTKKSHTFVTVGQAHGLRPPRLQDV